MAFAPLFDAVQPLVRYVDAQRAIVETRLHLKQPLVQEVAPDAELDVVMHITCTDGFEDEQTQHLITHAGYGHVRFELIHPSLWWPASMGEQPMYELTLRLEVEQVVLDERHFQLGMTSVSLREDEGEPVMLVNSQPCEIHDIVPLDATTQTTLLPAGANTLILVRDHYGEDDFYHATDCAGILTLQCIPLSAEATPEALMDQHVKRLLAHPSLAGWYIGHQGDVADALANKLKQLDPTRTVYRSLPAA